MRHESTNGFEHGVPSRRTESYSCLYLIPLIAMFSLETKPFPKDSTAIRFAHEDPSKHASSPASPSPRQDVSCTILVLFPLVSRKQRKLKTSSGVDVFKPRDPAETTRTNALNSLATLLFLTCPGRPSITVNTWRRRTCIESTSAATGIRSGYPDTTGTAQAVTHAAVGEARPLPGGGAQNNVVEGRCVVQRSHVRTLRRNVRYPRPCIYRAMEILERLV